MLTVFCNVNTQTGVFLSIEINQHDSKYLQNLLIMIMQKNDFIDLLPASSGVNTHSTLYLCTNFPKNHQTRV